MKKDILTGLIILIIAGFVLTGCVSSDSKVVQPETSAKTISSDNPYYLCRNGDKLLARGKVAKAETLYNSALDYEKDYSSAYTGLGKVNAYVENMDKAVKFFNKAISSAKNENQKLQAQTELIKAYYKVKPESWFDSLEKVWEKIDLKTAKPEEAALVMGKSLLTNKEFSEASVYFRQVIDWNGLFSEQADELLKQLYKQLSAEPGTKAAKDIALEGEVPRALLSVLLVEELKIIEYFKASALKKYNTGFQTPEEFKSSQAEKGSPEDIAGHPYEADIKLILNSEISGLRPFSPDSFGPDKIVTRAEFAMVIEDILVRIKGEPALKKEFIGNDSPFPDVTSNYYAFNAIVVCTTRDFLSTDLDGIFRPESPVTGMDTLLAIRQLKEEIKGQQINY